MLHYTIPKIVGITVATLVLNTGLPVIGYVYLNALGETIGRTNANEAGRINVTVDGKRTRINATVAFDNNLVNAIMIPGFVVVPPMGIFASVINSTAGTFNYFKYRMFKI